MVADDSINARSALVDLLRKQGMEVVVVSNGKDGLAAFEADRNFQLIVTDVNMPVMDGLTMIREIRKIEKGKKVPVIVVSADVGEEYRETGRQLGIAAWALKPVNPDIFINGIQTLLKKTAK
jgi:two-component system chemotaxis response regulator CheY